MKIYCDKFMKTMPPTCKKHLVVVERGIPQIFYIRLFKTKQDITFKELSANDEIMQALYSYHHDKKISEQDLKDIVQNIKHTYNSLKERKMESKTLETLSKYFIEQCHINLHFDHGILMEDESLVFFYDFSDNILGKIKSICKGGIL